MLFKIDCHSIRDWMVFNVIGLINSFFPLHQRCAVAAGKKKRVALTVSRIWPAHLVRVIFTALKRKSEKVLSTSSADVQRPWITNNKYSPSKRKGFQKNCGSIEYFKQVSAETKRKYQFS